MNKVIIAGCRSLSKTQVLQVWERIESFHHWNGDFELVCGMAKGVDHTGLQYCHQNGLTIHTFPANWAAYGKFAGPKRNKEMAKFGDILVAFWDNKSIGTKNMIKEAKEEGLKVYVVRLLNG